MDKGKRTADMDDESKVRLSDFFVNKEDIRAKLQVSEKRERSEDEVFKNILRERLAASSVALTIVPQDGHTLTLPADQEGLVGSGVIIHKGGFILTCAHVLVGEEFRWKVVKVSLSHYNNGESIIATVVDLDVHRDLAILSIAEDIERVDTHVTKLTAPENIKVGLRAYLVSNFLGNEFSFTTGVVSYDKRAQKDYTTPLDLFSFDRETILIECDAQTAAGSSGCGIFNSNRDLMGIFNYGNDVVAFGVHVNSIEKYLKAIWSEKLRPFESLGSEEASKFRKDFEDAAKGKAKKIRHKIQEEKKRQQFWRQQL